ncbi:hypothetical protein [Polluticaenibacter yanchengensis]|uniref:Uncharacterized protein n=1 Tax=Polluticaenibacter yanchengensis TaxID=3014562 RepID=A0ABT4UI30_9BACT|nr:hypothetical protein [Chitinophagaceae bacterium LY-5]
MSYYIYAIPIAVRIIFGFFIERILKRENLKKSVVFTIITFIATVMTCVYAGNLFFKNAEVLFMMPFIYIANAILLRYLLFNKYTSNWSLAGDSVPYDPILVKGGTYLLNQNNNMRKGTPVEMIYSIWIIVFPMICVFLYFKYHV